MSLKTTMDDKNLVKITMQDLCILKSEANHNPVVAIAILHVIAILLVIALALHVIAILHNVIENLQVISMTIHNVIAILHLFYV